MKNDVGCWHDTLDDGRTYHCIYAHIMTNDHYNVRNRLFYTGNNISHMLNIAMPYRMRKLHIIDWSEKLIVLSHRIDRLEHRYYLHIIRFQCSFFSSFFLFICIFQLWPNHNLIIFLCLVRIPYTLCVCAPSFKSIEFLCFIDVSTPSATPNTHTHDLSYEIMLGTSSKWSGIWCQCDSWCR